MSQPFLLLDRLSRCAGSDNWENRRRYRRKVTFSTEGGSELSKAEWIIEKPNLWDGLFLTPLPVYMGIDWDDLSLRAERSGKLGMQILANGSNIGEVKWPMYDRAAVAIFVTGRKEPVRVGVAPHLTNREGKMRRNLRFEAGGVVIAYFHGLATADTPLDTDAKFRTELNTKALEVYDETAQWCFVATFFMLAGMRQYYEWMERNNPG